MEIQYKSAWFSAQRIHEAMRDCGFDPVGDEGDIVEAHETYIGKLEDVPKQRAGGADNLVLTLVERGGEARSFHVEDTSIATIVPIVRENIARKPT